ncbi:MAG: type IV secretory system conjugative DNA transfer family protein [Desulfobulbaceae bacterium]|nr:type IV secretory system conjugative DNA transfer family protein [Desulfobulbaceae bacterium]
MKEFIWYCSHLGYFITIAKTRGGKGRGTIIPNLLVHPGSVFSVEIGGATLKDTINFRRHVLGQKIYVFDPFGVTDEPCASINLLDTLNASPSNKGFEQDVSDFVESIMQTVDGHVEKDPYFRNMAGKILNAMILYVKTASEEDIPHTERNLEYITKLLTSYGTDRWAKLVFTLQNDMGRFSEKLNEVGGFFSENRRDKYYDSVLTSTTQWLDFANTEAISSISKESTVNLADLRNDNITIYVVVAKPSQFKNKLFTPWLRLLVEQAINACPNMGDSGRNFTYEDRVLFMLDEFTHLGKLKAIELGMQTAAQQGITLWPVFQDIGQLEKVYGKEAACSFLSAAACIQCLAVNDPITAKFISERAGKNIALIPTVSQAVSMSETNTKNTAKTFSEGENFAKQHGSSQTDTETWSHADTKGWMQSETDAFTRGGVSSSGYSGGQHGGYSSSSGSNWSRTRSVTYGTSGSQTDTKGGSKAAGISKSETHGTTRQRSTQEGSSKALSRGLTITIQSTVQIIPKLDVADVYQLLNSHNAQILFITTNDFTGSIVDGRAYYDKIPILRVRAYGPETPSFPMPIRPLEGPKRLAKGLEGAKPQLALPYAPMERLEFPRLTIPSSQELEKVKVRVGKKEEKLSVLEVRELHHAAAQEVTDRDRSGWKSKFPRAKRLVAREEALLDHVADTKIAAIQKVSEQADKARKDALACQMQIDKTVKAVKSYAGNIAYGQSHVTRDADALNVSQARLLEYARRLGIYGGALMEDAKVDMEFFSELPGFERFTEFYHYLRERWPDLPEPQRPEFDDIKEHLRYANGHVNPAVFHAPSVRQKTPALPPARQEEPIMSLRFPQPPDIKAHIAKWKTWADPDKKDERYGLTEVQQRITDLEEELHPAKVTLGHIKRKVRSAVGLPRTDKQIRKEIAQFRDARSRLANKIYSEAMKELETFSEDVRQMNGAIARDENSWAQYLSSLKASAKQLEAATGKNAALYEEMESDLRKLHGRRDDLDAANKVVTGQRAQKAIQVGTWSIWDRYKMQTGRLGLEAPKEAPFQEDGSKRRTQDLTNEMPGGKMGKKPEPS